MNLKRHFPFPLLFALVLQTHFVPVLNGQDMLIGVVSNELVQISPVSGTLTPLAPLSPILPQSLRGVTYHTGKCLLYGVIDALTTPKLVSISLDGTTNVIGTITLPSNTVTLVEAISYNEADGQVYVSAKINQPAGPGSYFSASILQVNVDNAICSLVGTVSNNMVMADIDGMTHYNGDFFTLDASSAPGGAWARFYRFPPALIGSGPGISEIYAVSSFQTATDLAVFQDDVYFTDDRKLYKGDPNNFVPVLIGQMHTAAEYNGALLQAIAAVTQSMLIINLGPDLEICTGETATLQIPDLQGASIVWSNGVTGPSNIIEEAGTYWVQVTQGNCTATSDTILANFIECPDTTMSLCKHNYFIPLAFTPNGDGINDQFNVFFGEDNCPLEQITIKIFDRWGELVFEENTLSGWDGSFRDKPATSDVYVYLISMVFNSGGTRIHKNEKGDVTLIR